MDGPMQKLVEAHLGFFVAVAVGFRRYGLPVQELVAEGNLALLIAARRFDVSKGTRFSTYANHWIRAMMLQLIVRSHTSVGGGTGPLRTKLFFKLRRERAKIASLHGDSEVCLQIMATRFGVSREAMGKMLMRLDGTDVSLEAAPGSEPGTQLLDRLESDDVLPAEEVAEDEWSEKMSDLLQDAFTVLSPREAFVIEQRYLLDSTQTLAQVGQRLGVSRERARQLESRALDKLRFEFKKSDTVTGALKLGVVTGAAQLAS